MSAVIIPKWIEDAVVVAATGPGNSAITTTTVRLDGKSFLIIVTIMPVANPLVSQLVELL